MILIVIAAVAAAGVGILVQSSQKNAQDQTANKNLDVVGTLNIKGSTTVLPLTQAAAESFMKRYPAVKINVGGGGSDIGQLLAWTSTSPSEDIGQSSSKWKTETKTINGVLLPARKDAIIQEAGENAKVYETPIGTGMVVVAYNINGVTDLAIVNNTATCTTNCITFNDLRALYNGTTPANGTVNAWGLKVVQRSDPSGTEETFAAWIGLVNSADKQLAAANSVVGAQGNQGIRDYIASNSNSIGFVDIGFSGSNVNGNTKVKAATMFNDSNKAASADNKGVAGPYDKQSIGVRDAMAFNVDTKDHGLARDLFYYNQGIPTNAIKAYLDWIQTPDGQKIVQQTGFFSI